MSDRIIGIKLTHDAAVAVIEDDQISFSVEMEKVANSPRYSTISSFDQVESILQREGISIGERDTLVIDGWKYGRVEPHNLDVAPYHEFDKDWGEPLRCARGTIGGHNYISFPHVMGHVLGSYMTAPFAGSPAYCLVWDGSINPILYSVKGSVVERVCHFGRLTGAIYAVMGCYAGPFKIPKLAEGLEVPSVELAKITGSKEHPGKLLSWIAFGKSNPSAISAIRIAYGKLPVPGKNYDQSLLPAHRFLAEARSLCREVSEQDFLASLHDFLERQLVAGIKNAMPKGQRLCFAGGCALNIKWNSALRESGHFAEVWIPPFPNDSGSAIGAAAAAAFTRNKVRKLAWTVYSGPNVIESGEPFKGWREELCPSQKLAALLADGKMVVCLHSRSEIGPRALGHRSLLMSAAERKNADALNAVKGREAWRPVAPIALEEDAAKMFSPGTPDPYMLYDHSVKPEFESIIPAVVHMDKTARLQTVNSEISPFMNVILSEYKKLTGVGVLCNTSANFNGSGFFPDVASAIEWGKCAYVYCNNTLYIKEPT